jgi:hypothetical protein
LVEGGKDTESGSGEVYVLGTFGTSSTCINYSYKNTFLRRIAQFKEFEAFGARGPAV